MNKPVTPTDLVTPKVTTGPIAGSRKIYSSPEAAPGLRVPLREITLSDPAEAPVRVYDPSGPYTDPDATIDVEAGLPRARIDWVRERGGVEEYEGRAAVIFLDVKKDPSLIKRYGVSAMPTQIFFDKDGKGVLRHRGFMSEKAIVEQFQKMGVK